MRIGKTDIEQRALQIRHEYNIFTYGVKDIFSMISQSGIDLIRYPFGKDKLLGFSTFFEGRKVIVSNSSETLFKEIFTIAHELGHIVYDFDGKPNVVKIDIKIPDLPEDITEVRAFYFANCFLMPEEQVRKFIKFELKKKHQNIGVLDIVSMQLEFQVSYAAMVVRLYEIGIISVDQKNALFDNKSEIISQALLKKFDVNEKLLKTSDVIKVPLRYLEYAISNYNNDYVSYTSLQKALMLIGMDSSIFKKDNR